MMSNRRSTRIRWFGTKAADLVTATRHLLVVPFVMCFIAQVYTAAFILFVVHETLDFLDGKIASILGTKTRFGDTFDAFADCICHILALVCLLSVGSLPLWFTAVVVYREVAVAYLRVLAERQGVTISGEWQGKAKAMFYTIVIGMLLWNLGYGDTFGSIEPWPWIHAAAVACVGSGVLYLWRYSSVVGRAWREG